MKHTILHIIAFVLILSANACQKENNSFEPNGNAITVTAVIDDSQTKISYTEDGGNLKQSWAVNDHIVGFDENGTKIELYIANASDIVDGVAKFTLVSGSGSLPTVDGKKVYFMYAPGKTYSDIGDKQLTVDISSQTKDVIPALMMATGTVNNGAVSLSFSNQTSIICVKNPTIPLSKGAAVSAMTLQNVYTQATFSLDGSGNLIITPSNVGTITKTCSFTPESETGTSTATIYFAVLPNSAANLIFTPTSTSAGQTSYTVLNRTLVAGKYYRVFDKTFSEECIILEGSVLNFTVSENTTNYKVPNSSLLITTGDKSTYSYNTDSKKGTFAGTTGSSLFTFSLDSGRSIYKIEIICESVDLPGKVTGWSFTSPTLKWEGTASTSVQYVKAINNVTSFKVYYQ